MMYACASVNLDDYMLINIFILEVLMTYNINNPYR